MSLPPTLYDVEGQEGAGESHGAGSARIVCLSLLWSWGRKRIGGGVFYFGTPYGYPTPHALF